MEIITVTDDDLQNNPINLEVTCDSRSSIEVSDYRKLINTFTFFTFSPYYAYSNNFPSTDA